MWPLVLAGSALAVDIDSFHPSASAADGRGGLQVPVADTGDRDAVYVAGWGSWALRPLVQDAVGPEDRPVVASLVTGHVQAGWTLTRGARLDAGLAFAPSVVAGGFDDGSGAFEGPALGDVRVSALLAPLRLADGRVGLGIQPAVRVPTGNAAAWVGAGAFTGGATLVASARPLAALTLSAAGGAELSAEDPRSDVLAGNQWTWARAWTCASRPRPAFGRSSPARTRSSKAIPGSRLGRRKPTATWAGPTAGA